MKTLADFYDGDVLRPATGGQDRITDAEDEGWLSTGCFVGLGSDVAAAAEDMIRYPAPLEQGD